MNAFRGPISFDLCREALERAQTAEYNANAAEIRAKNAESAAGKVTAAESKASAAEVKARAAERRADTLQSEPTSLRNDLFGIHNDNKEDVGVMKKEVVLFSLHIVPTPSNISMDELKRTIFRWKTINDIIGIPSTARA